MGKHISDYLSIGSDLSQITESAQSTENKNVTLDSLIEEAMNFMANLSEAADDLSADTIDGDIRLSAFVNIFMDKEGNKLSEMTDSEIEDIITEALSDKSTGRALELFVESSEALLEGKTKSKFKFDLAARLSQFTGSSALTIARERKDPLFEKMMKFRTLYLTYKRAIGKKYSNASVRRAKDVLKKYKINRGKVMQTPKPVSSLTGKK